jgi:hypothetical protein
VEFNVPDFIYSPSQPTVLTIPRLLKSMIESGRWPRTKAEANAQHLKPLVAPEAVRKLAADESTLFLFPPPFPTVRARCQENPFWVSSMADPDGIDFDMALDIGDFGLGSDAPILLDYREDAANPRVIRLRWSNGGTENRWVLMAPDFSSFVEALGL